jgi:hypothetical protein
MLHTQAVTATLQKSAMPCAMQAPSVLAENLAGNNERKSFSRSFDRSFVRSFVRSFSKSLESFAGSLIRWQSIQIDWGNFSQRSDGAAFQGNRAHLTAHLPKLLAALSQKRPEDYCNQPESTLHHRSGARSYLAAMPR